MDSGRWHEKQCSDKVQYPNEYTANEQLKRIKRKDDHDDGMYLHVYKCMKCDLYHIGHKGR